MTDAQAAEAAPNCPKCGGAMWDNRASKRNPRAPDFKCRDKSCDGVIWPPRDAVPAAAPAAGSPPPAGGSEESAPRQWPAPAGTEDDPACPVCGGKMWDDRQSKRNPRAPDFKCRNKPKVMGGPGCPGVIWPPRDGERRPAAAPRGAGAPPAPRPQARPAAHAAPPPAAPFAPVDDTDFPADYDDDEIPF
jgi:hypothetical protein